MERSTHGPNRPESLVMESMASAPAVVWEADADDYRMLFVSPAARTILGLDPDAWVHDPGFWENHIHPDDRAAAIAAADRAVAQAAVVRIEYRFADHAGAYRRMLDTMQLARDPDGRSRLAGVMVELPDRPTAPAEAPAPAAVPRNANPIHAAIVNNLGDGVYYVDPARRITYWNHGAERLTGYRSDQVVGRACYDNLLCHVDGAGRSLCQDGCPLTATMTDGMPQEAVIWLRHADGSRRPVHVRTSPIHDDDGTIIGGVEIFSDATGLIEAQDAAAAARRDALTDPLTGLPNRRFLDTVLAGRKDDFDRHGLPFGMLVIDIDHFKRVNDVYGHDTGDEAIRLVAATIRGAIRQGDVAARWGGEEFAVVGTVPTIDGLRDLGERIRRIIATVGVPVPGAKPLPLRVSIGGAIASLREPLPSLFARADRALLQAKETGRDRVILDASNTTPRILGAPTR